MKMEMPVEAPAEGTVLELCVSEGQPVEEGDVVARLEPKKA
jgi:acetyl-CoA carboxylase biotin carboxyl carrier protein